MSVASHPFANPDQYNVPCHRDCGLDVSVLSQMISELNLKLIRAYTIIDYTADDQTDLVDALRRFAVVYYCNVKCWNSRIDIPPK